MKPEYQRHRHQHDEYHSDRPISAVVRDLITNFYSLIRSEINLAKAEITQHTKVIGKQVGFTVAAGVVIWLGVQAFLAFMIIGLGELLDGRYWLSALIVALLLMVPSAILAIRALKKIPAEAQLPVTQESIQHDRELLNYKVTDMKQDVKDNLPTRRSA